MSYVLGLKCKECGHRTAAKALHVCEACFGPYEVEYDYEKMKGKVTREAIQRGPKSLWRYKDLLPIAEASAKLQKRVAEDRKAADVLHVGCRLEGLNRHAGMHAAGVKLATPIERELSAGVVIMSVPADNRQKLVDGLYNESSIDGATTGGLRLCPHIYNTEDHVDRAIEGVTKLRKLWA